MTDLSKDPILPDALAALKIGPVAPVGLETQVARSLVDRGLLGRRSTRRQWLGWGTALAASVVGFIAGRKTVARPAASTDPRWMLLLYEGSDFQAAPAGREGERVAEYARWAQQLASRGRFVDGAELATGGRILEPDGSSRALDPDRLGQVAGYFLISAATEEEARDLAADCPHLRYRGRIALHPLVAAPRGGSIL